MKRTLALGGVAAGLLASAAIAAPAHAAGDVSSDTLASTNLAAQQVAAFWYGQAKANLINATPYNVETTIPSKHVSTGGPAADTKPGVVPAIGDEKKSTSTSKNVNLPKTTGKVFFIGADSKPHWCSATSVQSTYHNLVATAGHCVYDTESNKATLDKWVFIPGYYQGKTPWGIYVGKTAYTHYDFDVYEDGDRDYAFVTVYNGVLPTSASVSKDPLPFETKAEAEKKKAELEADKSDGYSNLTIERKVDTTTVGAVPAGSEFEKTYVTLDTWKKLNPQPAAWGGFKPNTGVTDSSTFNRPQGWPGNGKVSADGKTYYFEVKFGRSTKYITRTFWINYDVDYSVVGKALWIGLKDVGRLGDNVGGQGLAYNQKVGSSVFVFGYPSGSHPDGSHTFTGQTLKWSYGKTFAATAPSIKGDELVGVKSSFTGEGSIGSSWLAQYKTSRRLGYLNGVTIGVSDTDKNNRIDTSVSPYFDGETYGVYKSAAAVWSGKIV
ncbi:trypsin-like serine peptidase [Microbispora sp. ATCC PTA-5024]|uniref:trypsin-like serine peptidase n=1 Tax=Microbispora sp. ATCC PTA-5024 TaxID=316330 RepID=UPI0003DBD5A4|nr:hypothetical protein [Microbispora sp. ATCC PTA-5024]ETK31049.1 hypothetical protein MPTA5024_37320 [Microbispora sp. ATCC PTA-5024]